jgi:hypothetical protein
MSYSERDPCDEPEIEELLPLVSEDMCIPWWQSPTVKCQRSEHRKTVDGQVLARFVSRKEMLDGEARGCRTQNGHKLLDDKNDLQIRLIRNFTFFLLVVMLASLWRIILDCKKRQLGLDDCSGRKLGGQI